MVYLTLFFIPQSSRELQKWLGWTSSPTLEGFADSALASALSRSLSSSTGSQSDSVDQLSCTEHILNLLFIFLRSWFSQFVKVCHYCNKNTNHPITIIMIWLICFCPCQASNEKWKLRFQILHWNKSSFIYIYWNFATNHGLQFVFLWEINSTFQTNEMNYKSNIDLNIWICKIIRFHTIVRSDVPDHLRH